MSLNQARTYRCNSSSNIPRFRCRRCEFSANILNSIHTHYKIKHPEADQENPDFEERADDDEAKVLFAH